MSEDKKASLAAIGLILLLLFTIFAPLITYNHGYDAGYLAMLDTIKQKAQSYDKINLYRNAQEGNGWDMNLAIIDCTKKIDGLDDGKCFDRDFDYSFAGGYLINSIVSRIKIWGGEYRLHNEITGDSAVCRLEEK